MDLHPDLTPLAFLLGEWRGEGRGEWPTTEPFGYAEEMRFAHLGEPFLLFTQHAFEPADGTTIHTETGFWRPTPDGGVDVTLAHPLGVSEVDEGTLDGAAVTLRSVAVGRAAHGEAVRGLERRYTVEGDSLTYEVRMATDDHAMRHHLRGELRRV